MWYVVFFVSDFAYNSLTTNFYSLNYSKAAVFAEILPKIAGILNKYTEISEKPRRKQRSTEGPLINTSLIDIYLEENKIGPEAAIAIADALAVNVVGFN